MIQHDDFWDLVSRKVNVYRADLSGMNQTSVLLRDGREVPTDVLLCGTGWDIGYPFFTPEQIRELGLPHDPDQNLDEDSKTWNDLMDAADHQILNQYPILGRPPAGCKPVTGAGFTPARLYQGMASLADDSIVFLGRARMANNFIGAEAQAIWATAYWDQHVTVPRYSQAQHEVAYMNAFSRRRYPSRGVDGLNFHTDLIWYTEKILCEAGLTSHRKEWWVDPEEPYLANVFRDCKDEYLAKHGSR